MKKVFHQIQLWWFRHKPSKRRFVQLYAALLYNANVKGFIKGEIFTGVTKGVCVPGLNCYSCPGAVGSCPLGALQSALNGANKKMPYYVIGIILLYGLIFGRTICGWLCPVGLFQELAYKIRSPKLKKSNITRLLSYFKYVLLLVLVIIIPIMYSGVLPLPTFCKYICPAGIFEGALPLIIHPNNTSNYLEMLGEVFNWKLCLLIVFFVSAIFIYRVFCRFICPLGAIYSLFNKFCMLGVKVNKDACTGCGKCIRKCKMDVKHVGDHECINCGECISVCPTKAIQWKGKEFESIHTENTQIESTSTIEDNSINPKNKKRKTIKIITQISAVVILVSTLVYVNFFDKKSSNSSSSSNTAEIGSVCENYTLSTYLNEKETISIDNLKGKVTFINFWSTTCTGCVNEMTYFNQFYVNYKDYVDVIAIHTTDVTVSDLSIYIKYTFPDFKITFAQDNVNSPFKDYFTLDTSLPLTIILDKENVVKEITNASMNYEKLVSYFELYR